MEDEKRGKFQISRLAIVDDELVAGISASFNAIRQICSGLDKRKCRKLELELSRLTCYFIRGTELAQIRSFYEEMNEQCECASEQSTETGDV